MEPNTAVDSKNGEMYMGTMLKYDDLRAVFKFLKIKDLCRAARVCKFWKEAAYDEMAARLEPQYIFNQFRAVRRKIESNRHIVYQPLQAKEIPNNLTIIPLIGIVFAKLRRSGYSWNPEECFFNYVPSSMEALGIIYAIDIIVDHEDTEKSDLAVLTFLPDIPKLQIHRHNVYRKQCTDAPMTVADENVIFKEVEEFFENCVWNSDQKSKCILLLANSERTDLTKRYAEGLRKIYQPGTLSVWGGVCPSLQICKTKHPHDQREMLYFVQCTLICISSPSLQSWSIVVPESCKSEDEMKKVLQNFQKNIVLKKHSLAFVCAAHYDIENRRKEIVTFKDVFRKIPLVGFFSNTVFGLNTLNTEREKEIEFSKSTVFLVLTYG